MTSQGKGKGSYYIGNSARVESTSGGGLLSGDSCAKEGEGMASTLTKKRSRQKPAAPRAARRPGTSSAAQDEQLKELMKQTVREVLVEEHWTAGDPDAGLELRPEVIERLQRQEQEYAAGQRGRPLEDVLKENVAS